MSDGAARRSGFDRLGTQGRKLVGCDEEFDAAGLPYSAVAAQPPIPAAE